MEVCRSFLQGVATAAVSLIDALVKRNPDEYKGCVNLAVSRLSRVSFVFRILFVHTENEFELDCDIIVYGFSRLHILFRASTMVMC